jgi:hypothetical protein
LSLLKALDEQIVYRHSSFQLRDEGIGFGVLSADETLGNIEFLIRK